MARLPKELEPEAWSTIAGYALAMLEWKWFPDLELPGPAKRLMIGLCFAHRQGKQITKREACDLMGTDTTTTGPRYIAAMENERLVELASYPTVDKRMDFLIPTARLRRIVDAELLRLTRNLVDVADRYDDIRKWAGVDGSTRGDVPPGEPGTSLRPRYWPPEDVGRVIDPKTPKRKA